MNLPDWSWHFFETKVALVRALLVKRFVKISWFNNGGCQKVGHVNDIGCNGSITFDDTVAKVANKGVEGLLSGKFHVSNMKVFQIGCNSFYLHCFKQFVLALNCSPDESDLR